MFGEFRIRNGENRVDLYRYPRIASIVAYIALSEAHEIERKKLADLCYPNHPAAKALENLRSILHATSKILPNLLTVLPHSCALNESAEIWIDALEFKSALKDGHLLAYTSDSYARIYKALNLYKGELLPGAPDRWTDPPREEYSLIHRSTLRRMCQIERGLGNFDKAMDLANRMLKFDPDREDGHQEILRTLRESGENLAMMKYYESYQKKLNDEIGSDPLPETTQIVFGEPIYSKDIKKEKIIHTNGLPLIGRRSEVNEIKHIMRLSLYDRYASRKESRLMAVEGEPGLGKTRLIEELEKEAAERQFEIIKLQCKTIRDISGFSLFISIIKSGRLESDLHAIKTEIEPVYLQILSACVPEIKAALPFIGTPPPVESALLEDRLADAMLQYIAAWSRVKPLFIIIEDIHWIDADDMRLIEKNITFLSNLGILCLITYRQYEFSQRVARWPAMQRIINGENAKVIRLEGLRREEVDHLIRSCLDSDPPPPDLSRYMMDLSGGNPLFILKTVEVLFDEGLLFCDDKSKWHFKRNTEDSAPIPLHVDLDWMLSLRLSQLDPLYRTVLEAASILEIPFQMGVLECMLEKNDLSGELDNLVAWNYLKFDSNAYSVFHELLRNVTYGHIDDHRKKRLHASAFRAYSERGLDIELRCRHALKAESWDEACVLCLDAAKNALALYTNQVAIDHCVEAEKVFSLVKMPELQRSAAYTEIFDIKQTALARLERYEDWLVASEKFQCYAQESGDDRLIFKSRYDASEQFYYVAERVKEADRLSADLLKDAKSRGHLGSEAKVLSLMSLHCRNKGKFQEAMAMIESAIELLETSQAAPELLLDCFIQLGILQLYVGDSQNLSELVKKIQPRIETEGSVENASFLIYFKIYTALHEMRIDQALELANRYIELTNRLGIIYNQITGFFYLGFIYRALQNFKQAEKFVSKAFELSCDKNIFSLKLASSMDLSGIYRLSGRFSKLPPHVQRIKEGSIESTDPSERQLCSILLAELYLAIGQEDKANQMIESLESLIDGTSTLFNRCGFSRIRGEYHLHRKNYEAALSCFLEVCEMAASAHVLNDLWLSWSCVAFCNYKLGKLDAALDYSSRSEHALELHSGHANESQRIYFYRYLALSASKKKTEAYISLEKAYNQIGIAGKLLDDEEWMNDFNTLIPVNSQINRHWAEYSLAVEKGRTTIPLAKKGTSHRGSLKESDKLMVTLTAMHPCDEDMRDQKKRRQFRLLRVIREADEQGAVLSAEDIAKIFAVARITVIRDFNELREAGHVLMTRGTI